ncbi:primosomal protein N' [Coralloluteibacterium stylophorae]|uniref:Replication restart protein PriA n=1 Tax=Coralloluteibacterium stylophorae TaxID=1776034 RepID=A0A8J7VS58_9GAMM|nr:primosomal protein N' [Coralloluteibacterium stylophorae]MBS7457024.1 primosomal protein N' [Coralloluteibacterium stylophorae]
MSDPSPTLLRVALPVPLPQLFDYLPPEGTPATPDLVGCRVRVRFGPAEKIGVVAAVAPADAETPSTLREALQVIDADPLLGGELLATLDWIARYYHEPLGEVLATALPVALRGGEPLPDTATWGWRLTEDGRRARARLRAGSRPRALADRIDADAVAEAVLDAGTPGWRAAARGLHRRGYAERVAFATRAPSAGGEMPVLRDEQQAAADALRASLGRFAPMLLEGVTGSGKTEVYLDAIAACLERGTQALVLVPEIGLTPQTLARFRRRLGVPVEVLHSGLADGERARVWTACARGQARVVIGTRSAVFVPLPEPGLIVVDEEHDASYKQQEGVRYHARDIALVRARALAVPVVLGSATPALESLHNALSGRYAHHRLGQRATGARAPAVRVIDVRKRRLEAGLSEELLQALRATLERGEQALVFKNRRGYAPVLLCHDCGWSAQCRRCDAPMTVHARGGRLICHHCGARASAPRACPDCASLALQPQGAGTERIEDALAEAFPDALRLRIDRGTTQRRGALEQHLATLGDGPGILIGTQMLAKGHDLPRLTLVAVVGVDEGLHSADFRAPERLAQLLIQVAGRAGRADRPGQVLLQTHHPEHPLLHTLLGGGYPAFAALELAEREAARLPPYAHMALLRADALTDAAVGDFLGAARGILAPDPAGGDAGVAVHGPMPAPMARRAGRVRGQLLLMAATRPALHRALGRWIPQLYALPAARRVRWSLDVDPVDLY